jgi:hypothetical protein
MNLIYVHEQAKKNKINNRERKRTEPNSNRMISVRFVSMVVLSFEKSSDILDQVLWFLPNESLVER